MYKINQRKRFLSAAFNITPAEWEVVHSHQRGVCFVCGRPEIGKRLATDHSHEDGLFRGLLCSKCNPLLGKLENAFKRYGLHKVSGITLLVVLKRFCMYLANPPAEIALGRRVYGYPGKIGTKKFRQWAKKKNGALNLATYGSWIKTNHKHEQLPHLVQGARTFSPLRAGGSAGLVCLGIGAERMGGSR